MKTIMENLDQEKYGRAKKKVDEMKGFYIHLAVYVVVNTFILVNIYIRNIYDGNSFWEWPHFFTAIFWGIGLAFHAAKTFGYNPFFGKNWEKRQIQKYIEKDEEESKKYR